MEQKAEKECHDQLREVLKTFNFRPNVWTVGFLPKCPAGKYNVDFDSDFSIIAEVRKTKHPEREVRFGPIICQTYPS